MLSSRQDGHRRKIVLLVFLLVLCTACLFAEDPEAVSLTGQALFSHPLSPETRSDFEQKLNVAQSDYRKNPTNPELLIWVGRRTAYLGRYREAIEIFTTGIEKFPDDSRFYRHRGHRYLTTRQIQKAIADLQKAVELIRDIPDFIEPDGLPNSKNIPRSTNHFNIWYHLALAHYVSGDFEKAEKAYRQCMKFSTNDDMRVATLHWLYMTLQREGKKESAEKILEGVRETMEIFEDDDYHQLLLMYKGLRSPESLMPDGESSLAAATTGYGIGNWYLYHEDPAKADSIFREILKTDQWPAFGYLAAEAEVARSNSANPPIE